MSIQTDLASLDIIATVHRSQDLREALQHLVSTLHNDVPYFDWVGLYLLQGNELVLEAASDFEDNLNWESNSELRIPIEATNSALGKIVVRSKQAICFDVTDVTTLETLASEIRSRLTMN